MPKVLESLTDHVLAQVKVSAYSGQKSNKHKASEYSINEGAKQTVMKVSEDLFVNDTGLSAIGKYRTRMDNWMRRVAYPWGNGLWLVFAPDIPEFEKQYAEHETAFYALVESWLKDYEDRVSFAAMQRGPLFNRADYLTVNQLRAKFKIRKFLFDVPKGHFAVKHSQDMADNLHKHFERQTQEQISVILAKQSQKLVKVMQSISRGCGFSTKPDKKTGGIKLVKNRIVSATVEQAQALCDLYATCNLAADPALEQARLDLKQVLDGITAEKIRDSQSLRATIKDRVEDILDAFKPTLDSHIANAAASAGDEDLIDDDEDGVTAGEADTADTDSADPATETKFEDLIALF